MLVPVHHGHEGGQEPRRVTKRIMVVGITGAGKTSLVRTITGDRDFQGQTSMASHTSVCASTTQRFGDLDLVVVDTPGFFDTSRPWEESRDAIAGALLAAPGGFDMILFVVKASGRFTDEQHAAFSYMCNELFGAECLPHVVLSVTAAAGMTAEQVVREASQNAKLRDVVEAVEGRVLLFESRPCEREDFRLNEAAVSAMLAHLRMLPGPYDLEKFRAFRARVEEQRAAEARAAGARAAEARAHEELGRRNGELEETVRRWEATAAEAARQAAEAEGLAAAAAEMGRLQREQTRALFASLEAELEQQRRELAASQERTAAAVAAASAAALAATQAAAEAARAAQAAAPRPSFWESAVRGLFGAVRLVTDLIGGIGGVRKAWKELQKLELRS